MKPALTAIVVFVGSVIILSAEPTSITADALIRFKRADFRSAFCDHETLRSRIERRVAVVDRLSGSREVQLDERDTVATLMQKGGFQFHRGGSHLQFRLITKDAIYQSPHSVDTFLEQAFAKREVGPGDILLSTVVD